MKLELTKIILIFVFTLAAVFLGITTFGCGAEFAHKIINGNDGCQPEELRCIGTELQICNADNLWERITDCTNFEPDDWACCHNECRKVEECQ
jgi:hypothetical protein